MRTINFSEVRKLEKYFYCSVVCGKNFKMYFLHYHTQIMIVASLQQILRSRKSPTFILNFFQPKSLRLDTN